MSVKLVTILLLALVALECHSFVTEAVEAQNETDILVGSDYKYRVRRGDDDDDDDDFGGHHGHRRHHHRRHPSKISEEEIKEKEMNCEKIKRDGKKMKQTRRRSQSFCRNCCRRQC